MKPLVSILIPAYNAEKWIGETLRSAVSQTWSRKEIIVVNDGSTDGTAGVVQRFASKELKLVSTDNRGLSAAENQAYQHSQGDYIQYLDADDLLLPDKIERQLKALRDDDDGRILPSSPWAPFYYRTRSACFVRNSLWRDLRPVEWLLRKLGENLHMGNATWLVSRKLSEAAGPWDESLQYDQDGEYFARVLLASAGTRFVPETGMFYRVTGSNRVSHIGNSDKKKDSLLRSMALHIHYLQSLEESERVRKACLAYLQTWYGAFYPERPDLVAALQSLAGTLRGQLKEPPLRWKYAWMKPLFGSRAARWAQMTMPQVKCSCVRHCERVIHMLETAASA